jgi:uncharacterized membrane protein
MVRFQRVEVAMPLFAVGDRFRFLVNRLRERLWVKPLIFCVLSIGGAFGAGAVERSRFGSLAPRIAGESVEALLSIMASSMLVIATFAVASMVSAYASASSTATPRSFSLVIADDISQNALSTFIGAFIFSIVGLTAAKNGYFAEGGLFSMFVMTIFVFGLVILTFVRWVDRIARLGRLGTTIEDVEKATALALARRRDAPALHGVVAADRPPEGRPVFAASVGYVQRIDMHALQACAEKGRGRIVVAALPGAFVAPGRALAYVSVDAGEQSEIDCEGVAQAFLMGGDRLFDEDPRFGLVVLSEIASRALSPAVNDPGTAINIIGTLVRLFVLWSEPPAGESSTLGCDRVEVPELSVGDMFEDGFRAIARDGAGAVEVSIRLQKALRSLASLGDAAMRDAAMEQAKQALARAEKALVLPEDLALVRDVARFATVP